MAGSKRAEPELNSRKSWGKVWLRALRRQLYRPVTLVAIAAVVSVCLAWPQFRRLISGLESRPEYRVTASGIRITQPPHWVPANLVEQVFEQADLPRELSLLGDDVARDVAEAFALHPWVEEVVQVTKTFPATLDVKLTYRRPVGMVEVNRGMYPVDAAGILLPPRDFSLADARNYPRITGVYSTPQGPAGSPWGDPVVAEAALLAAELAPCWNKLHLATIVCPRGVTPGGPLDSGVFALTTSGGSLVIWGQGPSSENPGELETKKKIERLEKYASKFGGLDQPQGKFRIDIRHWRDITRTPLAAGKDPIDVPLR
jgi:hypothetical protein